ncbi:MAG: hypothetical protein FRX49_09047 [Trebouxia sp. A1-2]|nr:MAG: hypothetical protein FRX49_09047 [Trebouxia sp. A1-2]
MTKRVFSWARLLPAAASVTPYGLLVLVLSEALGGRHPPPPLHLLPRRRPNSLPPFSAWAAAGQTCNARVGPSPTNAKRVFEGSSFRMIFKAFKFFSANKKQVQKRITNHMGATSPFHSLYLGM